METIGLMRGNLLEVDGNYWTVDAILDKELYFVENDDYNHILNANPIPLTEDWLLKFGFVKCEGKFGEYFKCSKLEGFRIWMNEITNIRTFEVWRIGRKEYDDNTTTVMHSDVKHVHQLQNLYFALTGQELELKQTTEVNQ